MFLYNWQIREEWINWCETLSNEELMKKRTGGMGSILHNLFHVIDCEQIWVNQMQGTPVLIKDIDEVMSLDVVKSFSKLTQPVTHSFLEKNSFEAEYRILTVTRKDGTTKSFPHEKIVSHIIAHEIHHMGQLSVWSREIGLKPVSSDLLFRDLV